VKPLSATGRSNSPAVKSNQSAMPATAPTTSSTNTTTGNTGVY